MSSGVSLQSGARTRSFTVSGNYTSRLTDNSQVTVSTESGFRVVSGGPPSFQEYASGSFLMYSENGDNLVITVLPALPIDGYYLADLTFTQADGSTLVLPSIPFFGKMAKGGPFSLATAKM